MLLRQRFTTGQRDMPYAVRRNAPQYVFKLQRFAAVKRVCGITVTTAQRASGQSDENRWQPDAAGFTLEREKNLGDTQ